MDKINLHKQIGEVIFSNLIHSTINITKLKSHMAKFQRNLMQEKTKNKAWNVRNAKFQQKIIKLGTNPAENKPVVHLIKEKDNAIQRIKKKL